MSIMAVSIWVRQEYTPDCKERGRYTCQFLKNTHDTCMGLLLPW